MCKLTPTGHEDAGALTLAPNAHIFCDMGGAHSFIHTAFPFLARFAERKDCPSPSLEVKNTQALPRPSALRP